MDGLDKRTHFLRAIATRLRRTKKAEEKLALLRRHSDNHEYWLKNKRLRAMVKNASPEKERIIRTLIIIGEAPYIFRGSPAAWEEISEQLIDVEEFYGDLGGIVGYHYQFLKLLRELKSDAAKSFDEEYKKPEGLDIGKKSAHAKKFACLGIKCLPQMAFMFPVGGAGDRLNLIDRVNGEPLPAAQLLFCGKPLLVSLMQDLQAKEFLYYKLFHRQLRSPVIFMTSQEKNNHNHILDILDKNRWFDRPKEHFFFIKQPLVPVITEEGHWVLLKPGKLKMKPGGHGIIWKLAADSGALDWLISLKRKKILLRQINNPISGLDSALLAFVGAGCDCAKSFGFLSCPRLLHTAEGMDVLVEKRTRNAFEYKITNIEYTDFTKKGIADRPAKKGSGYSRFPANTNILFADIKAVKRALKRLPFPGLTINLKHKAPFREIDGTIRSLPAGRIESMMQNIADAFTNRFNKKIRGDDLAKLKTFILFNDREKTISVTKRAYETNKPIIETPEGCFYDLLRNNLDMLAKDCTMRTAKLWDVKTYIKKGPNIIFLYHPALGPLYQVIAQKIRGGQLYYNSELQLTIADLDMENLHLCGSLLIVSDAPCGRRDTHTLLRYSPKNSNCSLKNVKIINDGIDRKKDNLYWQNKIHRRQSLKIVLHGCAEFVAEDITIKGNHHISVPDGWRYTARIKKGRLHLKKERIRKPTWTWEYQIKNGLNIVLTKKFLNPRVKADKTRGLAKRTYLEKA